MNDFLNPLDILDSKFDGDDYLDYILSASSSRVVYLSFNLRSYVIDFHDEDELVSDISTISSKKITDFSPLQQRTFIPLIFSQSTTNEMAWKKVYK
jgi:hypothetical protein